ncbi:MAG: short-chain dehydrogenase [Phenylobacterium zucineum]|nr:MAG: short-chain dehydrogenase [Phenylobacterium zucineum]
MARRFAREGLEAVIVRRHADQLEPLAAQIRAEGGKAHPFGVDARDEDQMLALFEQVETGIAPIEACIFNIGANVRFPIAETTSRVFRKVWEMACFSGFLTGREAAIRMTPRGRGTIIFTGATASVRGRDGFAAFAAAKHGVRALAQSMARELGPRGIHVAHTIIDGAIDTAWIAENFPQRYALKDQDGILNPDHIADAYWMLHAQPRDAWTHELDLRPWMEGF